jgi:hypothetical protein
LAVLDVLAEEVGVDEVGCAQWCAHDVDPILIRPHPYVVKARRVNEVAAVRNVVDLKRSKWVAKSLFQELCLFITSRGLAVNTVLDRLGREAGLIPFNIREGVHDLRNYIG